MKKIISFLLITVLICGLFGANGICFADSAAYVESGTTKSPGFITAQYSVTMLSPYYMDQMSGESFIMGRYEFIPEETGDYAITISTEDIGSFMDSSYFLYIKDSDNNYIYNSGSENPVRTSSLSITGSLEAGKEYFLNIDGSTWGGNASFTFDFDKPLVAPLIYKAGTGGSITGDTLQIISTGEIGTEVTATADSGYSFSQWSDGVTTASRTDEYTSSGMLVTAEFTAATYTISPIDDITLSDSGDLPRATVLDENGDAVTGKKVIYTCETLTDYARISSSDRWIDFTETPPAGTYPVTVSLEDNSATPITFNIIIGGSNPDSSNNSDRIKFEPAEIECVYDGDDTGYYFVTFPTVTIYDEDGNVSAEEWGIDRADFTDYMPEPPTETGFNLRKTIPNGTYHLTYCLADDTLETNDFKIIVRNPSITYEATTGGSIDGEASQTVVPSENGTEVTAVPDTGYKFLKWSDDNTTATRQETNVTEDVHVTAEFAEKVILTVDETTTGATLQEKIETLLGSTDYSSVTGLNITGGALTDDDILWLTANLTNIETINITGNVSFTDNTLPNKSFYELKSLRSLTIDVTTTEALNFGDNFLSYCYSLESIDMPQGKTFGNGDFNNDYKLVTVSLSNATTFGGNAFKECQALPEISLPNAESIGIASLVHCIELTNANLPKLKVVASQMFTSDTKLERVNLSNATEFGDMVFWACPKPIEMKMGSTVPSVIYDADQPYSGTFGQYLHEQEAKVLIPESALADYQASAGWSDGSWYGWPVETYGEESSDNTLASLTVTGVSFSGFDANTTTYDLGTTSATTIEISTELNDSTATLAGDIGVQNLAVGENTFTIKVTAEDGSVKEYVLTIERESSDGASTIAAPIATPNGGYFKDTQTVTLATTTAEANIYYTLDGSEPTISSTLYTEPIILRATTTIKAIACLSDTTSSTYRVTFTKKSSSSSGSSSNSSGSIGSNSSVSNSDNTVTGEADNKSFPVGTKNTISDTNGKAETVISVNESAIKEQVNNIVNGGEISIPVTGTSETLKTKLSVQSVEDMQKKEIVLEIKTDDASYQLPTDLIDISNILETVGNEVDPEDVPFTVEISKTTDDMAKIVEDSAESNGLAIVVEPVDFKIEASYNNKTYEVEKFSGFVTRSIAIPENVDANRITTAIITDGNGASRHVPTFVKEVDGKYFATIHSLTNSTYTLIYNDVTFSDIPDSFWAKSDIEKMASRLIVDGKDDGTFSPNELVTRGEFAQVLVKALGLNPVEINKFTDVESGTKYAGYIGTAYNYGIIKGTSETTFNPTGFVTRQEAMAMVYRAGLIANLGNEIEDTDMHNYIDYENVSDYAKEAVKWNISQSIIFGKTDTQLAPSDNITRAELTAIANRLLSSAGLID